MTHTVGQGAAAFDWRRKIAHSKSVDQSEDRLCTQSLFIEPVRWMAKSINQLDGKVRLFNMFALSAGFQLT